MSDDPVKRVDELDQRLDEFILIPKNQYIPKWKMTAGIASIIILNLVVLSLVGWGLVVNNQALTRQIEPLQIENERQATVITDYEIVLQDAIGYIVAMAEQIKSLGGEPPLVELRPPSMDDEAKPDNAD